MIYLKNFMYYAVIDMKVIQHTKKCTFSYL